MRSSDDTVADKYVDIADFGCDLRDNCLQRGFGGDVADERDDVVVGRLLGGGFEYFLPPAYDVDFVSTVKG